MPNTTRSNVDSRFKLAQIMQIASPLFQSSEKSYSRNCIVNEILKEDFNINQKFSINLESRLQDNIHMKNCTVLHFLYYVVQDIDVFATFMARGADYTIKNGNGQTVFHLMITTMQQLGWNIQKRTLFINTLLLAHVKSRNFANPRDNDGISHFHGACMANHVEAAELFLDNGASIEETVNCDAPQFAGYTPLHFAVAYSGFEVAQMLIERGANVNAKTTEGQCPLDLLFCFHYPFVNRSPSEISEKEELVKLLLGKNAVSAVGLSTLQIACTLKDLTIAERLLEEGADIEYAVPTTSAIHPGDTALHFAADNGIEAVKMLLKSGTKFDFTILVNRLLHVSYTHKYSLQQICDLLSCIKNLKELRLSDGQTKLLDLILSMECLDTFQQFLENETVDITVVVPKDSVLWPGYTILHLAVTFSRILHFNIVPDDRQFDTTIVKECLNRGSSLNRLNLEEQTPIHLAYVQHKNNIVRLMFEHLKQLDAVANLVDQNNLSYLHIACAIQDEALADRLLSVSNSDDHCRSTTKSLAHMGAGSTPLHAAVSSGSRAIVELLLRRGADLHATDANGMTPIHRLNEYIFLGQNEIVDCLMASLSTNVVDHVVDGLGLSYLHIASGFGFAEIAEKLLDLGSNVNAIIDCREYKLKDANDDCRNLDLRENFTPLQMAACSWNNNEQVLDVLLRRDADIFVNGSNKFTNQLNPRHVPFKNTQVLRRFFRVLWEREDMQKSVEQRLGLTKLHVACYLKDEEAVRSALTDAVDVNVPVHADSLVFAGCTPLHLLVTNSVDEENLLHLQNADIAIGSMVKMLIDRGADVTIANVKKSTPIHAFNKFQSHFLDRDLCKDLLLNAHLNFSVNPMNDEGWSHFHLACFWHRVEIVEKFLQRGSVNVNQPLDYFIRVVAGCTPLHLALSQPMREPNADWTKMSQAVDLLLKHGADVAAKDVLGRTPLHTRGALYSPGMRVFEMLVSYGGNIKCEDLRGESPIERLAIISLMNANAQNPLTIFKRYGYKLNSWNHLTGEGYIAKIFLLRKQGKLSESSEFKKFVESSDARTIDDLGRTAIHNAVAHSVNLKYGTLENYKYAIESFMKIGIDIEHRDESGQTALHYAAIMDNSTGVTALLECGADPNALDNSGKSPFTFAMKHFFNRRNLGICVHPNVTSVLRLHLQKLLHLKLEVSHLNQSFALTLTKPSRDIKLFQFIGCVSSDLSKTIFSQVEMTKIMDVGTNSLTLFDFLSETAALTLYPLLSKSEREVVDHFFESIEYDELKELAGIIKLQYNKMRMRLGLIDSALSSLRMLLGFSVPGLCEQISRFLLNSELKNLIASTALNPRKRKLSEISS